MVGFLLLALLTPAAAGASIALPPGSILCKSRASAEALVRAVDSDSEQAEWLMGGACDRLTVLFEDQQVLSDGPIIEVEWSNGLWRRKRFLIPSQTAEKLSELVPAVTVESAGPTTD